MNKSAIQLKSRCYCVCYVASYLGSEVTVPSLSTGGSLMESALFKDTADAAVCVCSSLSSWRLIVEAVPPAFLSRISDLFEETQYIENTHFHTYHHKIVI